MAILPKLSGETEDKSSASFDRGVEIITITIDAPPTVCPAESPPNKLDQCSSISEHDELRVSIISEASPSQPDSAIDVPTTCNTDKINVLPASGEKSNDHTPIDGGSCSTGLYNASVMSCSTPGSMIPTATAAPLQEAATSNNYQPSNERIAAERKFTEVLRETHRLYKRLEHLAHLKENNESTATEMTHGGQNNFLSKRPETVPLPSGPLFNADGCNSLPHCTRRDVVTCWSCHRPMSCIGTRRLDSIYQIDASGGYYRKISQGLVDSSSCQARPVPPQAQNDHPVATFRHIGELPSLSPSPALSPPNTEELSSLRSAGVSVSSNLPPQNEQEFHYWSDSEEDEYDFDDIFDSEESDIEKDDDDDDDDLDDHIFG